MSTTAKAGTALFAPQTVESAPEKSRAILQNVGKKFGFIPNLLATFANNSSLLEGYLALEGVLEKGSFTPIERQLILLAASVQNSCRYCTAAHGTILKGSLHVPPDVVSAVRSNLPLPDPKLNALVTLTKEIVSERGHVRAQTIETFLSAGYAKEQILEVLIGVALKTMSNYADHISPNELDAAFRSEG